MNKIITNRTIAAAAFGAAAVFSMLSFGSSAEAASVASCHGATLAKVVSCCEQLVKKNGRPFWMVQSGTSCHDGRGLPQRQGRFSWHRGSSSAKRCYIQVLLKVKEGGGRTGRR